MLFPTLHWKHKDPDIQHYFKSLTIERLKFLINVDKHNESLQAFINEARSSQAIHPEDHRL